eukprot:3885256-Prymnesium_polylepis.1
MAGARLLTRTAARCDRGYQPAAAWGPLPIQRRPHPLRAAAQRVTWRAASGECRRRADAAAADVRPALMRQLLTPTMEAIRPNQAIDHLSMAAAHPNMATVHP